ncbi:PTS system, IIC component [uncultured Eubacteriales bacterium]|uniref:PTS system, IIC component n=1 Tax=uncultured Eubacteriales bacterium TaxID=172733 RepID=A0A212KBH6_9FIRM|nr:PTS system, IIC component [uncultured Eubacteriales bacterium]
MNSIPILIVVLLTLYVGFAQLDQISVQLGFYSPLFAATVTGLLLGNMPMGLAIGASMQLMTLGVATYGGATVPDFLSGSIMGTAFAIMSGQGAEAGVALAVPIGLLLTQLDVAGRMTNVIFQHRAERCAAKGDDKGVELCNILGILPWTLTRMIPVFLGLFFGEAVVKAINSWIPAWLMSGLKYAGGLLPVMGIALLMRYLPLKKFFAYYIIGFVLMAYLPSQFTILGVSLVGVALAAIYMNKYDSDNAAPAAAVAAGNNDVEVEIDE